MPLTVLTPAASARRAAAEVAFELACIFVTIWVVASMPVTWLRAVFVGTSVGFPALCIIQCQAQFPEFAWRRPALDASVRSVLWLTLASTALLLSLRYVCRRLHYDLATEGELPARFTEYLGWAFLQQVGLQTFLTRRMQAIFISPWLVSCAAALAFALIHLPNPVLVLFTFIGGAFWSWSFQRAPNLYVLALSHAWMAVVTFYCVPSVWLNGLRIGPSYWQH